MDNIESYLAWRGDVPIDFAPFNEVDNVVCCAIAYSYFKGIVPEKSGESISIADAVKLFFEKYNEEDFINNSMISVTKVELLKWLAKSDRYKDMRLSNYVDIIDEDKQTQFAAMHIEISDSLTYVAFRGTDMTIIGWQEDFKMASEVVYAQKLAAKYLSDTLSDSTRKYIIGGHSKGGNLAIYASSMCEATAKEKIDRIYDNDGPGFLPAYLESEDYKSIKDRIIRIVPEYCVIGMLLATDDSVETKIVGSNVDGILQHDIMTWQVVGCSLNKKPSHSRKSQFLNDSVRDWIKDATLDQRKAFANDFFEALKAGGSKDFYDLQKSGPGNFEDILLSLSNSAPKTKQAFAKLVKSLYKNSKVMEPRELIKNKNVWKSIILVVVGFFLIASPSQALENIGKLIMLVIIVFMITRIFKLMKNNKNVIVIKKTRFIMFLVLEALLLCLFLKQEMLNTLMNLVIAAILFLEVYQNVHRVIFDRQITKARKIFLSVEAVFSFLIGSVTLVLANNINSNRLIVLGTYLVISNVINLVVYLYNKMKYDMEN